MIGVATIVVSSLLPTVMNPGFNHLPHYTPQLADERPPGTPATAPVFVLVFDELSAAALVNEDGQINAARFPNFSRLATSGAVFTEARSNYSKTRYAVPAIAEDMSAVGSLRSYIQYRGAEAAIAGDCGRAVTCRGISTLAAMDRGSIFKHLALATAAELIPPPWNVMTEGPFRDLASIAGVPLATSDDSGLHLFNEDHLNRFLTDIGNEDPNGSVYLFHSLVTHQPYLLEPDGEIGSVHVAYDDGILDQVNFSLSNSVETTGGQADIGELFEAYLDQIAYADELLGRFLDRLEETSLLDRSVIVVTADHGIRPRLHRSTPAGIDDWVTNVPLILSAPGLSPAVVSHPVEVANLAQGIATLASGGDKPRDPSNIFAPLDRPLWFNVDGRWIYHLGDQGQWELVAEIDPDQVLEHADAECFRTLSSCRFPLIQR